MKTTKIFGILVLLVSFGFAANAQTKEIRQGNKNFRNGNYAEAEKDYKSSLDKKYNDKAQFNLGDAYYQQKNFDEASRSFQSVADRNVPKNMEASAYYNLGNSMMEQQKYAEAFNAFKNCLKIDPNDEDARYNLEYARQKMIMQQQQQQNQENKENQEKKDNQENEQDRQKQQQQQQQQEQKEQEQQQQQQQQQKEQQMSKEEAERMLQALENQEKETMEKMNEAKAAQMQKRKIQKDW